MRDRPLGLTLPVLCVALIAVVGILLMAEGLWTRLVS